MREGWGNGEIERDQSCPCKCAECSVCLRAAAGEAAFRIKTRSSGHSGAWHTRRYYQVKHFWACRKWFLCWPFTEVSNGTVLGQHSDSLSLSLSQTLSLSLYLSQLGLHTYRIDKFPTP